MADNFPKDASSFKLLISDFDGTLAAEEHIVTPKVVEAVRKWIDSGRYFSIATGRQFLMLEDECRKMGLITPVVVRGGAEVVDPTNGQILHSEFIKKDEVSHAKSTMISKKCDQICRYTPYETSSDVYFHI